MQALNTLASIKTFVPHGYCLNWTPSLLWLHAGSDALMVLSYFNYPFAIAYFVWKRQDLPFRWLYLIFFIAFIVTCAGTHAFGIVTIWYPLYWLEGYVKAVSAIVAFATVFAIWWVIPRALKLPSQAQLEKARAEAEAANLAKSVFLANMSHELRTPLNAILGFSQMLQKDVHLPEQQRRNVTIINRSGEHLLGLINDVLDMAKIDAGRIYLESVPFDLGSMMRDLTDMMSVRASDKNLRLLVDQSSCFPRFVRGDEARLRQILINLVGNALKFTREGGVTLRLRTRQNATAHLLIEIEDTGPGIAAADRQRIFEPFVQLGEQGDSRGTGLGLAITRQLVQLMGGQLALESTPGKGSLFRIDLPLQAVEPGEIATPEAACRGEVQSIAPGQPPCRVLIVEDQLESQLLLSQLMENVGIESKIANNGQEALALFQSWRPHLIWMDRRMPVMDGIEATLAIRRLEEGKDVKIVAVTASAFIEQREEMLAAGMDDFVRKPYRTHEIYECLERHLGLCWVYAAMPVAEAPASALTPASLAPLPEALRHELKAALESLETERIANAIARAGAYDPTLETALSQLAGEFNYPAILNALKG